MFLFRGRSYACGCDLCGSKARTELPCTTILFVPLENCHLCVSLIGCVTGNPEVMLSEQTCNDAGQKSYKRGCQVKNTSPCRNARNIFRHPAPRPHCRHVFFSSWLTVLACRGAAP